MIALKLLLMAASAFLLGGLWYSNLLFGKMWCADAGIDMNAKRGHPARIFGFAYIFALISAVAFAQMIPPSASVADAAIAGMKIGALFVGASFGINYQFADRKPRLLAIDAGYHTLQFILYGVIFALWPK